MSSTRLKMCVHYLHHTRDADGDVILYFFDPRRCPAGTYLQSSPVVGIHEAVGAAVPLAGGEPRGLYVIETRNTDYEVQMPRAKAEHLAWELGGPLLAP